MTGHVARIWRHPIKGHGREALPSVSLKVGQTVPWDRHWAIAHDATRIDGTAWAPCQNFSRGSKTAAIMAIGAILNETSATVTLTHPVRPPLTFSPDLDADAFLDWVRPLMDPNRTMPARIVSAPGRGMTDSDFPSVSIGNLASLRALSDKIGAPVAPERFRLNFWLDGLGPWEEFEWIGHHLRLGDAVLRVEERILRCLATHANPETGRRDLDVLGALEAGWDHREFGVYATVTEGGEVREGDGVELAA